MARQKSVKPSKIFTVENFRLYSTAFQKMAERLCGTTFLSLASRRKASSIGLLCKLLDSQCRGPLQNFCPLIVSVTHAYSFHHVTDDCRCNGQ